MPKEPGDWMGTPAAGEYLGVSLRMMYKILDQGLVPAYYQGRVIRIRRSDLDAYLETVRLEPGTLGHLYQQPDGEEVEDPEQPDSDTG